MAAEFAESRTLEPSSKLLRVIEQKLANNSTRTKEAELQLILNKTPFMLTRCSADLRYRFASAAYAEMLGCSADEINGKTIVDVMGEEGFATVLPHIRSVLNGEMVEYETEIEFRGVGPRYLHVIYTPEKDEQGKVIGWISSIRDLTESKRTEHSLDQSLRREQVLFRFVDRLHRAESDTVIYEAALDSILSGLGCQRGSILLFDESGVMRFVASRGLTNDYVRAVEGHTPWQADDFDAQPISVSDIATAEMDEHLRTVIRTEGIRALNFIPLISDRKLIGKFMFYYNEPHVCSSEELVLALNIGRQLAFAIAKKRTDDALFAREHQLRQLAEESNRLKDEFIAIMSHELRNPLNVIVGYSELLVRSSDIADSPYLFKMAEAIKRNAEAQAKLVQDVLDLSRLRSGKLNLNRELVSVLACVNNAVDTVRYEAAEKKITIAVNASDESVAVDADPIRLQQIVWNLLNNSIKFTPAGGTITVSISINNGNVSLTVKDDGQGIDPAFLPHVFEIFRQADTGTTRAQSGMGVGLAVLKQLVELHNGSVSVTSDGPGRGSKFVVALPASKRAPVKPSSSVDLIKLDKLRVLVVDDSEDTADMLKALLTESGALVMATTSGSDALRIGVECEFDVVLTDISMPGMDGFEFLRNFKLTARSANVPVLALTGLGRSDDIKRARTEGFYAHLTKPLDIDFLLETLKNIPRKI